MSSEPDEHLDDLLEFLRVTRGFDFTVYKRPTLTRRLTKRLQDVGVDGYDAYRDYLELHPEEFESLFDTVLINVTAFFRDPEAWHALARGPLPKLLSRRDADAPIRIWSAGCATGEEAYTVAMVLAEAMGEDEYRRRVKIYATDVDEAALAEARTGRYAGHRIEGIPRELVDRYFERVRDLYTFRADLRRTVIFGVHDVTTDAPISRLDLLLCRNVLMYLIAETQQKAMAQFRYALRDDGLLFLGRAETLLTRNDLFTPIDQKHRIFAPSPTANNRDQLLREALAGEHVDTPRRGGIPELAFGAGPQAQMVLDVDGYLILANAHARAMFGVTDRDVGRPFQDLEASYRPLELRSRIEQAYTSGSPVVARSVERHFPDGTVQYLDIVVTPLSENEAPTGVSIVFNDVSELYRLRLELERRSQELETINEELQSTNEELETSNEELQSTNEELETTNEELQSTNEELETTNEELQSTNDELQSMNDEFQRRNTEIDRVNAFLNTILGSLDAAVVVVDPELRIEIWNEQATDLWGLRPDEVVGTSFLSLDSGLPVEEVEPLVRSCLTGDDETAEGVVGATNRRGRSIRCRVMCTRLHPGSGGLHGAVILMQELRDGG